MKIRTTANQKNFVVDDSYYTENELRQLERHGVIEYRSIYENVSDYRISVYDLREVKVILDDDGYYYPVVITVDGLMIHIKF